MKSQGEELEKTPKLDLQSGSRFEYRSAALSESFLVVLLEEFTVNLLRGKSKARFLQVFRRDGKPVGEDRFEGAAIGNQWEPNTLIAIHESKDRTWIAVGGWMIQDGVRSGSIKIYCIEGMDATATMTEHVVPFARPKPNPLASDSLETLGFGPDGDGPDVGRLVCATRNNRVLVWRLADTSRAPGAPFIIERELKTVSLSRLLCLLLSY